MSHFAAFAGGLALAVATVGGALVVLAQPKPDATSLPIVLEIEPNPMERADPPPIKSDAERIEDLQNQLHDIAAAQRGLIKEIDAIAERPTAGTSPSKGDTK